MGAANRPYCGLWLTLVLGQEMNMEFPDEVARMLEAYVYLYIDPRNQQIFYIGKGRGNRAFQHLTDTSDKAKVARIREIVSSGRTPTIEVLRYGLTDSQAEMIEASAIDLMAVRPDQ